MPNHLQSPLVLQISLSVHQRMVEPYMVNKLLLQLQTQTLQTMRDMEGEQLQELLHHLTFQVATSFETTAHSGAEQ